MPTYTLERGGKTATVESPRELTPQELSGLANQHFGAAAAPTEKAPSGYDDKLSPLVGGILDTLGMTQRPGARSVKDVMVDPKDRWEHLARFLGTTGALMLGGAAGAPLVGPLGAEALTAGALGALEEKAKGGSAAWGALRDATLTGLTGAAFNKAAAWLAAPGEKLAAGIRAPAEVLDTIRARLPKGKFFNMPSLSKSPLTVDEAVEGLSKLRGKAYTQGWAELADNIDRLDIKEMAVGSGFQKIPGPTAAEQFAKGSSSTLPAAPGLVRRAAANLGKSDELRRATEALATDPTAQQVGVGAAVSTPHLVRRAVGAFLPGPMEVLR